jgi:phosphotransferase system IIA component
MEVTDIIFKQYYSILENKKNISDLITENINVNEQFSFGDYSVDGSGSAIIKNTSRIVSPIDGKIKNSMSRSSSCINPVVILSKDGNYILEYCNISNVKINDNSKVNVGELIGTTNDKVKVTLYNKKGRKIEIDSDEANTLVYGSSYDKNKSKNDNKDPNYRKDKQKVVTGDSLVSAIFQAPFKALAYPFKNKYDPKTGEMTQKRWGSPVDKKQVDPWILQSLGLKKGKKVTENNISNLNEDNKLSEEIIRIKQLIK